MQVGMRNEIIWIVKDGQGVKVGTKVHGHHDKLLKFLHQFFTVMLNAVIVDTHYKDHHSHRMTTRFVAVTRCETVTSMLREITNHKQKSWARIDL